jgi:hypothetical protein
VTVSVCAPLRSVAVVVVNATVLAWVLRVRVVTFLQVVRRPPRRHERFVVVLRVARTLATFALVVTVNVHRRLRVQRREIVSDTAGVGVGV